MMLVDGNDNDLLLGLLTGAVDAPVASPVDRETALLLFVVGICCFGTATLAYELFS
ncbi:MAG: hypothetical protein ACJ72V_12075 [Nitrososphaeraceae archaeon]